MKKKENLPSNTKLFDNIIFQKLIVWYDIF